MDDSGNFLSLPAFQNKYNLKVRPLAFYGLISAIKLLKRQIPQNTRPPLKYEGFLSKFVEYSKPSRPVYKKLVSKKSEQPISSQQKWLEDINTTINWKTAYQLSFQCTKSTKLIAFNFKFLHRRLSTNNFLKKIGLVNSEKCTFCQRETETLVHLLWECPKIQSFWISLSLWLQSCKIVEKETLLELGTVSALGLNPDRSKYKLQINFCCLLAKYYIWICKHKEFPPKLNDFYDI